MKKLSLVLLILVTVPTAAYPCSMTFPVYGVYSGGTALMTMYLEWNFALLLGGAVLLKAVSYAFLGNGSKWRLFGAMIAGNLVTTMIGYLMEFCHVSLFDLVLIPSFVAMALFHYAGKILWPLDYQARYPKRTLAGFVGILTLCLHCHGYSWDGSERHPTPWNLALGFEMGL